VNWEVFSTADNGNHLLTDFLSTAHNMPVVRSHTCVHVMEWLKLTSENGFNDQVFPLVKVY
jgi:hypothetical protein